MHGHPPLAGPVSGAGSAERVQGSRASLSGLDGGDQAALLGLRVSQTTNPFFLCKTERPLIKSVLNIKMCYVFTGDGVGFHAGFEF